MIIKLLALFLLITTAYFSWWSIYAASFLWLALGAITSITGVGLFLSKHWSQYLWHAFAFVISMWWLISVIQIALSGWPYGNVADTIISLIPGFLLITLCAAGSVVVRKHFRAKKISYK